MQKTITVLVYPAFHASSWGFISLYKGRELKREVFADKLDCMRNAEHSARQGGFTDIKYIEENTWGQQTIYKIKL